MTNRNLRTVLTTPVSFWCPGCSRRLAHRRSEQTLNGARDERTEFYDCDVCGTFEIKRGNGQRKRALHSG